MNLTLAITPLNASAIPASWITLSAAQPTLAGNGSCQTINRFDKGNADCYGFTRVLPAINQAAPSAESVTRDVVNEAINRVKDRFGVHQAKHIIRVVGGSLKMLDIAPDRFPRVLSVCRLLDGMQSSDPSMYHWIHRFNPDGVYMSFTNR